jgi:hypothetical protein
MPVGPVNVKPDIPTNPALPPILRGAVSVCDPQPVPRMPRQRGLHRRPASALSLECVEDVGERLADVIQEGQVPRFITNAIFVDADGNGIYDPPGGKDCTYDLAPPP